MDLDMRLALSLLITVALCSASETVTLQTKLGTLTGIKVRVNGSEAYVFKGIPYAKPPIKDLRLVKPVPYGSFGNLDATKYGDDCAQTDGDKDIGSEDCLALNIYKPSQADKGNRKAVMIWIHGGSFLSGSAASFPAEALTTMEDIIVVTINYRLNIFGFLTTADRRSPGNIGLWDQHMAIKWVHDNIEDYGGDNSQVTIFGESAGGRSTVFHMLSPKNDHQLFQKVIAESGSAFSLTFLNRNLHTVADILDHISGITDCPPSDHFISCLQSIPTSVLLQATRGIKRPFPFLPIPDDDFLPYDLGLIQANFTKKAPLSVIKAMTAQFSKYDLLAGWNNQEGLVYMRRLNRISQNIEGKNISDGISDNVLTEALFNYPFFQYGSSEHKTLQARNITVALLKDFYMTNPVPSTVSEGRSIEDRRIEAYMNIAGDNVLKLPVILTLHMHAALNEGKTFGYEYTHKRSGAGEWYEGPDWLRYGADHTDEIPYVFGYPFLPDFMGDYTDAERELSRRIMMYWTSFVKTGNPGFPEFMFPSNQTYLEISLDSDELKTYPLDDEQRLWSAIDANLGFHELSCVSNTKLLTPNTSSLMNHQVFTLLISCLSLAFYFRNLAY